LPSPNPATHSLTRQLQRAILVLLLPLLLTAGVAVWGYRHVVQLLASQRNKVALPCG